MVNIWGSNFWLSLFIIIKVNMVLYIFDKCNVYLFVLGLILDYLKDGLYVLVKLVLCVWIVIVIKVFLLIVFKIVYNILGCN